MLLASRSHTFRLCSATWGGKKFLKRWEISWHVDSLVHGTFLCLHLLLLSTSNVTLHPEYWEVTQGTSTYRWWERGSQECSLPLYLWHPLRPHTHQLVLYPVIHFHVGGKNEGKVSGRWDIYSSDPPGICWVDLAQSTTELPKCGKCTTLRCTKSF